MSSRSNTKTVVRELSVSSPIITTFNTLAAAFGSRKIREPLSRQFSQSFCISSSDNQKKPAGLLYKKSGHLDTRFHQFLYLPGRLAELYVKPGDRVLDFGCGPGFFTREFAKRVGKNSTVFSVDLQEKSPSASK